MAVELFAMTWQAHSPDRLARFWGGLLRRQVVDDVTGPALVPTDDAGFLVRFVDGAGEKLGQNRMHYDLTSSSPQDQQETVDRALRLGGRRIDVGQGPDAEHVVLADPEGNELCVLEPGNRFLAGCGFLGALACDGSPEVGAFWSAALQWPLVWDQDQETAVQSPSGGPKITWGGPPYPARWGRDRVHFDLAPTPSSHVDDEVVRLGALGATWDRSADTREVLHDPDGNEFWLWHRR